MDSQEFATAGQLTEVNNETDLQSGVSADTSEHQIGGPQDNQSSASWWSFRNVLETVKKQV